MQGALIDLEAYRNRRAQAQKQGAPTATPSTPPAPIVPWMMSAPVWVVWVPVWRFA